MDLSPIPQVPGTPQGQSRLALQVPKNPLRISPVTFANRVLAMQVSA